MDEDLTGTEAETLQAAQTFDEALDLAHPREEDLLDLFLDSPDLAAFLTSVSELAARFLSRSESVPGTVLCSVTVGRHGRRFTIASSSPVADAMDELQYASGEGPCQECVTTGQPVYLPDIQATQHFPRYREAVGAAPLRSVFAAPIPLPAAAEAHAALNCYSTEADGFPQDLREQAEELASLASRSLHSAVRLEAESDRSGGLAAAMESRTTINLATGVVMAQSNCTSDEAVQFLKDASMNRNQKLRDVAAAILARYGDPEPGTYFR